MPQKIVTGNFEVPYKCAQCGATDTNKYFATEQALQAINCWKCHAGMKMDVPEMLQRRIGMFPVQKAA